MISHGNKRFEPGGSSSRLGSELASAELGLSSASSTFCEVSKTCSEGRAEAGGSLRLYLSLKILFETSVPSVSLAHGLQQDARNPLEHRPQTRLLPLRRLRGRRVERGGSAENHPGPE